MHASIKGEIIAVAFRTFVDLFDWRCCMRQR